VSKKKLELVESTSFFDENVATYSWTYVPGDKLFPWEPEFIEFMRNNSRHKTLLDVGAGSGRFAMLIRQKFSDFQITALDPSTTLLEKIEDESIRKVVGKLPDLNLSPEESFYFIHVSMVLHHLVGKTINESKNIVKESLRGLREHLEDAGSLMIVDEAWETYMIPTTSRTLTFFLLSLADRFNITMPGALTARDANRPSRDLKGLVACFYTLSELENLLKDCGFEIVQSNTYSYPPSEICKRFKRRMLLKRWRIMWLIARKATLLPL
jgi:ubiquinone/menaquinone biosynthesis C-methylase UbiE